MDKENMICYKYLLREIKYFIDTKYYYYQMKLCRNISLSWELRGYSDADYVGDNETRNSVKWYIVLINGEIIAWCWWSQKVVTLFVPEDKYSAITKLWFEILFIHMILLFMGVVVEYPIIMHIDNVGSIFLSKSTPASQRTKHINVCHHLIHDSLEDGTMKIKFVRSEENMAYPCTNDLSNGPF